MAGTQVTADEMAAAAKNFDNVNAGLQQMLSTLMNELSSLSGTWKGMGAAAFDQVKVQYETDLKSLNSALAQTAESIRVSGVNYTSTDDDAASRVTGSGGSFSLPL
ncbi:WXG100 family type VII secretion target [Paractinoplanes ovalisporus]|uniref:WXG100 family type VII secretion target n=1 Tax=Paractinoplanes ovalisporus TaxID=2810368 RepID=UPI0027DBAE17|nr:WXG100 family type VII secretion target [Actinoplanes ovalisporus]